GGLRSRKSRFLPGHLVFPGGKLEPVDGPGRPGALARCATREVREETGVAVPAERWLDAGERTTPPFFTVRFRPRFFVAEMPRGARLPDVPPSPGAVEGGEGGARVRLAAAPPGGGGGGGLGGPPAAPSAPSRDRRAPARHDRGARRARRDGQRDRAAESPDRVRSGDLGRPRADAD